MKRDHCKAPRDCRVIGTWVLAVALFVSFNVTMFYQWSTVNDLKLIQAKLKGQILTLEQQLTICNARVP